MCTRNTPIGYIEHSRLKEPTQTMLELLKPAAPTRIRLPNQAPTYYHWADKKPVTTNQVYGFSQREWTLRPHPERPANFFKDVRPFDNLDFYKPDYDGKHEWDLTASHSRSPPLGQWRPSRRFCLKDTFNRYDINKGYIYYPVPPIQRLDHPDFPQGVHLKLPDCMPKPAYLHPTTDVKDLHLWTALPSALAFCRSHPAPKPNREYFVEDCTDRGSRP